ncbi:TPA: helix-turn-helix transcriptional regulator [Serratia marcescens]|uniref:helix-turn-helix transcriptional regulator n=1 Tax=Serratia sp. CC22-02 TaxID=1378076 RepID=UPI0024035646|nr:LuxR family transcriptional regulator [Serratia sp. CC22-02]SMP62841.1 fimbrial protein FimW [Serratia sp. CC22-02]
MKPINIIIDDENRYFAAGLRLIIAKYAQQHNKIACFLAVDSGERPDIVLTSQARRVRRWGACAGAYIVTIKERQNVVTRRASRVLYRSDDVKYLFTLLTDTLANPGPVCRFASQALTPRERQVIGYLRRGLDQSQTARVLGVSVKTIHSHKRSIMSKMMLDRPHDFIYWLLSHEGEYS